MLSPAYAHLSQSHNCHAKAFVGFDPAGATESHELVQFGMSISLGSPHIWEKPMTAYLQYIGKIRYHYQLQVIHNKSC